jgi:hypothetical protein
VSIDLVMFGLRSIHLRAAAARALAPNPWGDPKSIQRLDRPNDQQLYVVARPIARLLSLIQ